MGIGHSRKNFPIMPCASLHTNNTKTNNNKKEDAEFVFQQLWKAIGLRLWPLVILVNKMDRGLWGHWVVALGTLRVNNMAQLIPYCSSPQNRMVPPMSPIRNNPSSTHVRRVWAVMGRDDRERANS